MRLNTIKRQKNEMLEKINLIRNSQSQALKEQINTLIAKMHDVKYDKDSAPDNEGLLKILEERIQESKNKLKAIDVQYDQCLNHIIQEIEVKKRYVFIELENGGNIKFEFSNYNDSWYKSCHDLIMSRFCAADYVSRSISGIKMRKVIRVTNRLLLSKYEENILKDVDEFDYINNKPSLRKKVDYLMYCWRPKLGDHFKELFDIIVNGFKDTSEYKSHEYEEAIPFTNSMSIADFHRIESLKEAAPKGMNNMSFKHGKITAEYSTRNIFHGCKSIAVTGCSSIRFSFVITVKRL